MMASKIHQVLTDDTYEIIKSLLMDHIIKPGERVSIDGLSRKLKVSQTPIREVLARLESEELVTRKPHSGYYVTDVLSLKELRALYAFRMQIEPKAAELACLNMDSQGKKLIRKEIEQIKNISIGKTYAQYKDIFHHDIRFHSLILELSGNKFLSAAFEKAHCHLHMFRLNPTSSKRQVNAIQEHLKIATVLQGGNPRLASWEMKSHIKNSQKRMLCSSEDEDD